MKLFLVSQNQNNDYDTYDSFVVACETEDEARNKHPWGYQMTQEHWCETFSDWCSSVDYVNVKYLGEADKSLEKGVVCASFNAG